jgi:ABC-type transport system substrate-binding protein
MNNTAALRPLLAALTVTMLIAACSGAGAPAAPGSETPPSASPSGSGGGSDPGPGSGGPIAGAPGDPGVVNPGQPQFVVPQPGQQNVHPVSIEEMEARVDGRRAVLNARWWSGIEPCTVLDSVAWKRDGKTITISVREGSGQGDLVCIDIAVYKATVIDLGELEPGDYTVIAGEGNAAPITFTIA